MVAIPRSSVSGLSSHRCFSSCTPTTTAVEEEEKKTDDPPPLPKETHSVRFEKPSVAEAPAPLRVIEEKKKNKEEAAPNSVAAAPSFFLLHLLDLALFVLLSLYGGVLLIEYAKEELFSAQYEGLIWDGPRKADEIT